MKTTILAALSLFIAATALAEMRLPDIDITWEQPIELGRGCYARIHPLANGRLMAAYESHGAIIARTCPRNEFRNPNAWSAPKIVATNYTTECKSGKLRISIVNAEFAQLESGRIIYGCNFRPEGWRADLHPFCIAISTSDDNGETWSPLKIIRKGNESTDGRQRGCYEPFILPQKGNSAQLYYADETPYQGKKQMWQEISVIETTDGGETWSEPRATAYTPERRDGMPAVIQLGDWRYLSIEANPARTRLHPQVVRNRVDDNWSKPVLAPSEDRFEPLLNSPDWNKVYGGAPYIAATANFILLSWQEHDGKGDIDVHKPLARVAAMTKEEARNGRIATMRSVSTPPGLTYGKDRMMWPSLCPLAGDDFLLVIDSNGHVRAYPGRVEKK